MALYKAIYITQILTKAFIEKYYIQYAMRLQTYCSRKHEAADPPCVQQGANHSYRLL
jgi:hypothetical protein